VYVNIETEQEKKPTEKKGLDDTEEEIVSTLVHHKDSLKTTW